MKTRIQIDWNDYYLEGTPSEIDSFCKSLSKLRTVTSHDGNDNIAVNPDEKLRHTVTILREDATVTIANPATPE